MSVRKLTERQQRFVEAFVASGNASEAAIKVGYADGSIGRRMVTKGHVAAAITLAGEARKLSTVASRKERHSFWTKVARDPKVDMKHRLKASELLGKANGDFFARVEHTGAGGGPVQHVAATVTLTGPELEQAVRSAIAKV